MSLLLHIDTSLETASVLLSLEGKLLGAASNASQYDHASWIQLAIKRLMDDAGYQMQDLNAIAVVSGPGSYTGLRVGMATAKGLCYALNIPLLTVDTLFFMASAAKLELMKEKTDKEVLLCAMIDARRMEVFTAIYDIELNEVLKAQALILDESSYQDQLNQTPIIFFGNGSDKWRRICTHHNARFIDLSYQPSALIDTTYSKFLRHEFTALAYAEPVYIKEFYIHPKK